MTSQAGTASASIAAASLFERDGVLGSRFARLRPAVQGVTGSPPGLATAGVAPARFEGLAPVPVESSTPVSEARPPQKQVGARRHPISLTTELIVG